MFYTLSSAIILGCGILFDGITETPCNRPTHCPATFKLGTRIICNIVCFEGICNLLQTTLMTQQGSKYSTIKT